MPLLVIAFVAALLSGQTAQPEDPKPEPTHEEIAHLPQAVQDGIIAWRERLRSAVCLKVVCETDETWRDMHWLDDTGSPIVVRRERYQVHSWMTPDLLWMVIFPYSDETADTTTPHYQLLWKKGPGLVWERVWDPNGQTAFHGPGRVRCRERQPRQQRLHLRDRHAIVAARDGRTGRRRRDVSNDRVFSQAESRDRSARSRRSRRVARCLPR